MIAGHVRNYTPSKHPVQDFKATCKLVAMQAHDGAPLDDPLYSEILFLMPRPAGRPKWIKKGTLWWDAWKAGHRVPHIGKPDRDNLMKSFQDALNGVLFRDDALLYDGPVKKWVAGIHERPGVHVTIETKGY